MKDCPACGYSMDRMKDMDYAELPEDMDYADMPEEEDDEEDKKAILEEMLGLSQEARKAKLPKKSVMSVDIMKVVPKKK